MPPARSTTATAAAIANHGTNQDQATITTSSTQHACAGADKPNKQHHHATAQQAPSYEVLTNTSQNWRAKPPTTQALPLHHGPPCHVAPSLLDAIAASSCPRTGAKQSVTVHNGCGLPGPRRANLARPQPHPPAAAPQAAAGEQPHRDLRRPCS
jgi:hypothetical protein